MTYFLISLKNIQLIHILINLLKKQTSIHSGLWKVSTVVKLHLLRLFVKLQPLRYLSIHSCH